MKKVVISHIVILAICFLQNTVCAIDYKVITGNPQFTYYKIGLDLAKYIAPEAGINLEVLPSQGSIQNIVELRDTPGVKFAIVQHDVYQKYRDYASQGDKEALRLIEPLRVIFPLYFEEVHFLARSNLNIQFIHEIENKKINIGPENSGTALTASTIYKRMFNHELPPEQMFTDDYDVALKKLADQQIDVVIMVGGQPIPRLLSFKREASELVKLLELDTTNPIEAITNIYYSNTIKRTNYEWMEKDVLTLAVKAYLITYNYPQKFNQDYLRSFARSLGKNLSGLENHTDTHPKWKEVFHRLESLPGGWEYYEPTYSELSKYFPVDETCSRERWLLGICSQ